MDIHGRTHTNLHTLASGILLHAEKCLLSNKAVMKEVGDILTAKILSK